MNKYQSFQIIYSLKGIKAFKMLKLSCLKICQVFSMRQQQNHQPRCKNSITKTVCVTIPPGRKSGGESGRVFPQVMKNSRKKLNFKNFSQEIEGVRPFTLFLL